MKHIQKQSGFAMLFTVLLVSLILSIALSISELTLKESVLSNLAKDSGIAFYQADAAVECGMYQDTTLGKFPKGINVNPNGTPPAVPATFTCGTTVLRLAPGATTDYFQYVVQSPVDNQPCLSVIFDKRDSTISKVDGSGYNLCGASARRVERTLEVKY